MAGGVGEFLREREIVAAGLVDEAGRADVCRPAGLEALQFVLRDREGRGFPFERGAAGRGDDAAGTLEDTGLPGADVRVE